MEHVLSKTHTGRLGWAACLLAAVGWCGMAHAQLGGVSVYAEGGRAWHNGGGTNNATLGVRIPTSVTFWDGRIAMSVDAYASHWYADAHPWERSNYVQVGVVPMFRYRFDQGRSPWFVEGGVGVSYLNHHYISLTKSFGTLWNFSDHLGAGYSFGAERRHEVGMYLKHVSNAGLKGSNPGETFVQLRYAYTL